MQHTIQLKKQYIVRLMYKFVHVVYMYQSSKFVVSGRFLASFRHPTMASNSTATTTVSGEPIKASPVGFVNSGFSRNSAKDSDTGAVEYSGVLTDQYLTTRESALLAAGHSPAQSSMTSYANTPSPTHSPKEADISQPDYHGSYKPPQHSPQQPLNVTNLRPDSMPVQRHYGAQKSQESANSMASEQSSVNRYIQPDFDPNHVSKYEPMRTGRTYSNSSLPPQGASEQSSLPGPSYSTDNGGFVTDYPPSDRMSVPAPLAPVHIQRGSPREQGAPLRNRDWSQGGEENSRSYTPPVGSDLAASRSLLAHHRPTIADSNRESYLPMSRPTSSMIPHDNRDPMNPDVVSAPPFNDIARDDWSGRRATPNPIGVINSLVGHGAVAGIDNHGQRYDRYHDNKVPSQSRFPYRNPNDQLPVRPGNDERNVAYLDDVNDSRRHNMPVDRLSGRHDMAMDSDQGFFDDSGQLRSAPYYPGQYEPAVEAGSNGVAFHSVPYIPRQDQRPLENSDYGGSTHSAAFSNYI